MNADRHGGQAFSLVEVALALALAAFCLVAILGLLPVGLKSNQTANAETGATSILSTVAADLRATPPTSPPGEATVSGQFGIPIPAHPLTGSPDPITLFFNGSTHCATSLEADSRYRLTVTFPSGGEDAKTATFMSLRVSWPAMVVPENAAGSVTTFLALDRN